MKIYTRGGDKGRTSLFTGGRVDKDDARIEALGSLDELVAALGLAKAAPGIPAGLVERLEAAQTELYLAMADIAGAATPHADGQAPVDAVPETRLPAAAVARLEAEIDRLDADLPALTQFVIPGTSPASAALHLARTVCRRAERRVLSAARGHHLSADTGIYLNRLADLLFVMARWADRDTPQRTFRDTI